MFKKKGGVLVQFLVFMIVVVFISAIMIFLLKSGVLSVKEPQNDVPNVLNTEFFIGNNDKENFLVNNFEICSSLENFNCGNKGEFWIGDEVFYKYYFQSPTINNQVMIIEEYQVLNSNKEILFAQQKNFNFNSDKELETRNMKNSFFLENEFPTGEYILRLEINNLLLRKKVTLEKKFKIKKIDPVKEIGGTGTYEEP